MPEESAKKTYQWVVKDADGEYIKVTADHWEYGVDGLVFFLRDFRVAWFVKWQHFREESSMHTSTEEESFSILSGWRLERRVPGEIVVTHKDDSGAVIKENSDYIPESMFYRMMDRVLQSMECADSSGNLQESDS